MAIHFDRETLEAMAAAGLKGIKYGVESADQEVINTKPAAT